MELPPRARRIRSWWPVVPRWGGTTSACAENTLIKFLHLGLKWNYLRVRGEYTQLKAALAKQQELPPRARRIPCDCLNLQAWWGTTSACAENTWEMLITDAEKWNYLRVRGEYGPRTPRSTISWELPPRARRIRFRFPRCASPVGTTSACAENTR